MLTGADDLHAIGSSTQALIEMQASLGFMGTFFTFGRDSQRAFRTGSLVRTLGRALTTSYLNEPFGQNHFSLSLCSENAIRIMGSLSLKPLKQSVSFGDFPINR